MAEKKANVGSPDQKEIIAPLSQSEALAAAQAAFDAVKQAAINPVYTPKETVIRGRTFTRYTRQPRTRKRNQQRPFLWRWSPGTLAFGKTAEWTLQDNATDRRVELVDGNVERICVGSFNDDNLLYIWVVDGNDPDAFVVKRNKEGYLEANISAYLFDKGLVPKAGLKEKFDLLPAPELIDNQPALCIHLDKPIKTGRFTTTRKKKDEESPATSPTPGAGGPTKTLGTAESPKTETEPAKTE